MFGMILLSFMFSIIHSSDGGADDFATTAVIAAAQEKSKFNEYKAFDLPSIIITNADCEPVSALLAYQKNIHHLNIPTLVGLSESRVWNQFPWVWRMESEGVNQS